MQQSNEKPKAANHGAKWTNEQDNWLLHAISKEVPIKIISSKMERSNGSIISRLKVIALREITNGQTITYAMMLTKLSRETIEEFIEKQKVLKEHALEKKLAKASLKDSSNNTNNSSVNETSEIVVIKIDNTLPKQLVPKKENNIDLSQLNEEQRIVVENVKNGKNILITGSAGCGKSFVVKYIIQYATEAEKPLGICAMTGSAAVLIGGTTLHSFMGIGLARESVEYLVRRIVSKESNEILKELEMLIIDEVSMMNDELFTKVSQILSLIRKNPEPFGGVQIILVGDPFQLCPIENTYFFKSPEWTRANFQVALLKLNMRQAGDDIFKGILDRVRWGNCSKEDYKILKKLRHTTFPDGIIPTRLYSHNKDVDSINYNELENLVKNGRPCIKYNIKYKGDLRKQSHSKSYAKAMKLNEDLILCPGAQVVLTRNLDILHGLVNGARGTVIEIMPNYVTVQFVHRRSIVKIEYYAINAINTQMILSEPLDLAYIPLKLAWALSIHSSQGMTLDALELDLGSSIFAYGQAYTGLSRAKDMKSVKLVGLLPESFKTSPDVIEFYNNI
jgi:ATP-dependent DNA helicase PIF1